MLKTKKINIIIQICLIVISYKYEVKYFQTVVTNVQQIRLKNFQKINLPTHWNCHHRLIKTFPHSLIFRYFHSFLLHQNVFL